MRLFLGKLIYIDPGSLAPTGVTAYGAVALSPDGDPILRAGPYPDADAMAVDVRKLRQPEAHQAFHLTKGFVWEPPAGEHWFGEHAVVRFEGLSFHEMSRAQTLLGVI